MFLQWLVGTCSLSNYIAAYEKTNKITSCICVILCVVCFQRQFFRFLLFKFESKNGKELRSPNI